MVVDRVLAFSRIKKRGVHGARAYRRHRDTACAQLLRRGPGEVLDGSLATGISRIERRERPQQRGDNGADLAVVVELFARLLDKEERGLGIDRHHLVVLDLTMDCPGITTNHPAGWRKFKSPRLRLKKQ